MEKRIQRNIKATDEEWKVIQATAKERFQTPSEFLMSIVQKETSGEQNVNAKTVSKRAKQIQILATLVFKRPDIAEMAKRVRAIADRVSEKPNEEWMCEIIKELVDMIPEPQQ